MEGPKVPIKAKIEMLQNELNNLLLYENNILNENILDLSRELDEQILLFIKNSITTKFS